ncbi:hypothetical protein [Lactobacillus gallinarum]|uniref:hypothetical protein n=1 Tax=Lactobacillus gallinarum TaxID=52242 RepID=UPI000B1297FA|nr:hypothetical protein [Lactobacillus gallinarum]
MEVKKFKRFFSGLMVIEMGLVLAACSSNSGLSQAKTQTMNTYVSNEISTLDSSKYGDTTSSEVLQNSMEGLYRFDKNNKAILAELLVLSILKINASIRLICVRMQNGLMEIQ